MIDVHLVRALQLVMKRHRGEPLPLEKKLQIVSELLQQRNEREALMASRAERRTKRRTTTHQTAIARRCSFGRSVDSTNSIIVSIVNSKKNKTVAHNQKERRQTKGTTRTTVKTLLHILSSRRARCCRAATFAPSTPRASSLQSRMLFWNRLFRYLCGVADGVRGSVHSARSSSSTTTTTTTRISTRHRSDNADATIDGNDDDDQTTTSNLRNGSSSSSNNWMAAATMSATLLRAPPTLLRVRWRPPLNKGKSSVRTFWIIFI
jgi:hypothetical protein